MTKIVACTLHAKAYLLSTSGRKRNFDEVVPLTKHLQIKSYLQALGSDILHLAIKADAPDQKFDITWDGLLVCITFYAPLHADLSITAFVSTFHEAANDTYLEGDATVFKDYELIFDDFVKSGKKKQSKKFENYWN